MWTREFARATLERALRTFAQSLVGVLSAGMLITDSAQWKEALVAALTATLLSVLMSIAAGRVGDPESPSFVDEGVNSE